MMYSHRKSGQPGKITRLMSCTDEQWEAFPDKDLMPTHRVRAHCCSPVHYNSLCVTVYTCTTCAPLQCCSIIIISESAQCAWISLSTTLQAPSYTHNPHNGDVYSAYNKPEAVLDWLAHNEVEEDFVLILDADMIMRAPFIPEDLGAKEGTAISAYYGYLKVGWQTPVLHDPAKSNRLQGCSVTDALDQTSQISRVATSSKLQEVALRGAEAQLCTLTALRQPAELASRAAHCIPLAPRYCRASTTSWR